MQRSCGRRTWGEHEVRVEKDGTVHDEATQAGKGQVEKFVFTPRALGTTEGSQAVMQSDLPLRTIPLATRGGLCNVLSCSPCRNKGLLSRVPGGPLSECHLHVAPSWMVSAGEGTGPSHTPSQEGQHLVPCQPQDSSERLSHLRSSHQGCRRPSWRLDESSIAPPP